MMLNHVQERLVRELLEYAHAKYPEVSIHKFSESPENANHIWVIVRGLDWHDDDRIMDFTAYMSLKEEDILVEYGYHFSLMPISLPGDNGREEPAEAAGVRAAAVA